MVIGKEISKEKWLRTDADLVIAQMLAIIRE
jgi:hypothetical protein